MNLAKSTPVALGAIFLSAVLPVQADTVFGVYAGAGGWQQELSGELTSSSIQVDAEADLGMQDDTNKVFYIAVEHGVPILPNLRARYFDIDMDGENVLSRSIQFNGQVFTLSDQINSEVDFSQSDAVMYYQLLDNVISVDMGLAVSLLEGSIQVVSASEAATADFDEVVPMLYSRVRADLPFSGFWIGAEGQGVTYEGNSLVEFNTQIGWESRVGLGIEAGWRAVQLELESFDEVDSAELDVTGPYASVNYHF